MAEQPLRIILTTWNISCNQHAACNANQQQLLQDVSRASAQWSFASCSLRSTQLLQAAANAQPADRQVAATDWTSLGAALTLGPTHWEQQTLAKMLGAVQVPAILLSRTHPSPHSPDTDNPHTASPCFPAPGPQAT